MPGKRKRYVSETYAVGRATTRQRLGGQRYARPVARAYRAGPAIRFGGYRRPTMKMEKKFVDLASATYALNTTGSIALIPVVAQGAGESQRIGRKINLMSVQMHGYCLSDTATVTARGRVMIVYDRQPNAALAAITDVLDTISSQSFLNDQNKNRFRVLYNRHYAFSGNITTPATGKEIKIVDEFIKLRKLETTYGVVGTGAIGDIKTGALLLVTVGDVAAGTADANAVLGFRVRFYDP